MLGGNLASITTLSVLSNLCIALVAPLFFSAIGQNHSVSFFESFLYIFQRMFLLVIVPFVLAQIIRRFARRSTERYLVKSGISFYLWVLALIIVTARTVDFILAQDAKNYYAEIVIAVGSLLLCLSQFFVGKRIGKYFDDTIAGGQGFGQKNTILGIWMSQTYLNPIASLGPGAYVLWQNIVNSYQVWKNRKNIVN
jgi:BASS family bile acid:Na+ symporter